MLFLRIARSNTRWCRRWRLWMTLQRMYRSHLWHSMLIDGVSMRVMIGVVARVGRVVSMQWQSAISWAAISPRMTERIVGRVVTRNLWWGYRWWGPILARSFTQRSYTKNFYIIRCTFSSTTYI